MSNYDPFSLQHPNASLTWIVAQIQKYLNEHPPDGTDPGDGDGYNPVSLQYPEASIPYIVAQIQKALSEGQFDNSAYNPVSLQNPQASIPAIVAQIQKYLTDNPIPSDETLGTIIDQYLEEHPIDAPVTSVNSETGDVVLDAADVGAVPTSRTVNNKALSSDVVLDAADVGAVPTSRTVNNKALSSNITLSGSDIVSGVMAAGNTINQDLSALNSQIANLNSKVIVTATLTTGSYGVYATAVSGYSLTDVTADMVAVGYRVTSGLISSLTSNVTITTSAGQVSVACTSAPTASVTLEIYLI